VRSATARQTSAARSGMESCWTEVARSRRRVSASGMPARGSSFPVAPGDGSGPGRRAGGRLPRPVRGACVAGGVGGVVRLLRVIYRQTHNNLTTPAALAKR
jgi:hypothetical protein